MNKNKNGYNYQLFPSENYGKEFKLSDVVWVLKGNKLFAKAKILEEVCKDESSEFFGRCKVGYVFGDNSTYHCKPERLVKIEQINNSVIICETTRWYRHWAKTQIQKEDSVIEIGSAFGTTTSYIKERCKFVIGIDKSEEYVAIAKKDFPKVEFMQMDVIKESHAFIELAKKNNINKLFIDINGNRPLKAVEEILEIIEPNLKLECIVVKSEELFRKWKEIYKNKELD